MAEETGRVRRLDPLHPDTLDTEQRRVYDDITTGPRSGQPFRMLDDEGRLLGPFDALVRVPGLGEAVQLVGERIRFHGSMDDRIRELVILTVAVHWDCEYEWYAHSRLALDRELLTAAELAALRRDETACSFGAPERAVLELVRSLLAHRQVPDDMYGALREHLSEEQIVEIAFTVGHYGLLAAVLTTFAIAAPE